MGEGVEMLKDELGELSRMKSKRIVCALPIACVLV